MNSAAITALPISKSTYLDIAAAMTVTAAQLSDAAIAAWSLLQLAGMAGSPGDTADDLNQALRKHLHLVREFDVKVKTDAGTANSQAHARTSFDAFDQAARGHDDAPFGISIMNAAPAVDVDRAALLAANRALSISMPLDDALKNPSLAIALKHTAKRFRPAPATDHKKLAANDRD